jgi:hypothetical protein
MVMIQARKGERLDKDNDNEIKKGKGSSNQVIGKWDKLQRRESLCGAVCGSFSCYLDFFCLS